MQRWSIRLRILAVLAIGAILTMIALLWLLQIDYTRNVNSAGIRAVQSAEVTFKELQRRDTMMLSAVLDGLTDRPQLRAALAAEDTATLLAETLPLYSALEGERGITHLYFISREGKVLLRVHRPEQFGDQIERGTFHIAERTRMEGDGLELGATAFALRSVRPVYEGGSNLATSGIGTGVGPLIGYMEVAEDIDHFTRLLPHREPSDDYAILLSKSDLKREAWQRYKASSNLPDNWDAQRDYVVASQPSTQAWDLINSVELPSDPGAGPRLLRIAQTGEKRVTALGSFPIIDASGQPAGMVVTTNDVSAALATLQQTRRLVVLVVSAVMVGLGIVLLFTLNHLVFHPLVKLGSDENESDVHQRIEPRIPRNLKLDEIDRFAYELARGRRELDIKSMLLDSANDVIWVYDADGAMIYANEAAIVSRGYSVHELQSMNVRDLVPSERVESIDRSLKSIAEQGSAIFESEDLTRSGERIPVEVHSRVIQVGDRPAIMSVVRDLSERLRAQDAIQRLAYFDPLTSVANRRLLGERLETAIARVRRSGHCLGVVFVDLDRLKPVNDSFGHSGGDLVLSVVADRLIHIVRETDTVARVGGDEFVLLFCDTEEDAVEQVVDRMLAKLGEPIAVGHSSVRVTASAGVALFRGEDESAESLIRQADLAMYAAKAAGRNRYCIYAQEMGADAGVRVQLHRDLATAFDNRELTLQYQPVVRLSDGGVIGAEALCRWTHPTMGPIPPSTFIPLAEESGLILPIGRWVLSEACRQASEWHALGLTGLRMAINASVHQLIAEDFAETVSAALRETALDPRYLIIEVTEGTAMGGSSEVRNTLQKLHESGITLAVDDFGVGYSALDSIAEQPFDMLKVDRAFVAAMSSGPERKAIVRTIVDLGMHLSLLTVAEGVETQEQADWLQAMSCEFAQGFLYGPALVSTDFLHYAQEHRTEYTDL